MFVTNLSVKKIKLYPRGNVQLGIKGVAEKKWKEIIFIAGEYLCPYLYIEHSY